MSLERRHMIFHGGLEDISRRDRDLAGGEEGCYQIRLNFRPVRKARAFGIEFKQVHGVLFLREAGPQVPRKQACNRERKSSIILLLAIQSCCYVHKNKIKQQVAGMKQL
ncbi:hypothetical protein ACLOJK_008867 [Asimina triloba]